MYVDVRALYVMRMLVVLGATQTATHLPRLISGVPQMTLTVQLAKNNLHS